MNAYFKPAAKSGYNTEKCNVKCKKKSNVN